MSKFGRPLSLALAFSCSFAVWAQQPTKSSPPPDYSHEAFVYEQIATELTFENDGTATRDISARVRVQSDAAVQHFGLLRFSYQGSNETTDTPTVRVLKHDGTTVVTPADGVQDILGDVTLNNPNQLTTVSLDDSSDSVGRSVTITSDAITGLAPANIYFPHNPSRLITILGGSGGNLVNVQSTAAGTTTTWSSQPAGDTANVGLNGSVQGILGNLNLDPTSPTWRGVMVDDSADPTSRAVTITGTSITGLAPGVITYAGVQNLTVDGGSGGNRFSAQSLPPAWTSVALNGGGGTNTLDYSQYFGDITVNLPLGIATGFTGGISNIRNVTGSQGNDLIVGDANANMLVGGAGRNIIIGGGGSDTITGGGGDNILIGGTTVWDTNAAALNAIMQEWTDTSLAFDQRVNALRKGIVAGGQTYALNTSTVMADSSPDSLIGGGGQNWFFLDKDDLINNGAGPGPNDRVTHLNV